MNRKSSFKSIQTMQELADHIGLSRQTLSKYFNDPSTIGKKTRERIREAVQTTGFRPNLLASNLKREKSRVMGIIIPSMLDPFFMKLVTKISLLADLAGYFPLTLSSNGDLRLEEDAVRKLQAINAAGALVVPLGIDQVQSSLRYLEDTMPTVYIDTQPGHEAPFVGTDNLQSIETMVNYLLTTGSSPVFLSMPLINHNAIERQKAYIMAMEKRHEEPKILYTAEHTGWQFERYGHFCTAQWLSQKARQGTTLLCANDRLAYGAFLAAWETGVSIGAKDSGMRIAGHDDHPLAAYTCPPLTTVAQDYDKIADTAMQTLMSCIEQNMLRQSPAIPATLIRRQSA